MLAFYEAELFGDDLHFSETVKNNFKARVSSFLPCYELLFICSDIPS